MARKRYKPEKIVSLPQSTRRPYPQGDTPRAGI